MSELGIDISSQLSKSVDEFAEQYFDYVLTVCDNAKESCPVYPGHGNACITVSRIRRRRRARKRSASPFSVEFAIRFVITYAASPGAHPALNISAGRQGGRLEIAVCRAFASSLLSLLLLTTLVWGGCISCEQYFMFGGAKSCCSPNGHCKTKTSPSQNSDRECKQIAFDHHKSVDFHIDLTGYRRGQNRSAGAHD